RKDEFTTTVRVNYFDDDGFGKTRKTVAALERKAERLRDGLVSGNLGDNVIDFGRSARQGNGAAPAQPQDVGSLEVWDAGDDPGAIPPREWLQGNQFCRGFISSIVAAGGTGKSALRLLQFISLATGRPLS